MLAVNGRGEFNTVWRRDRTYSKLWHKAWAETLLGTGSNHGLQQVQMGSSPFGLPSVTVIYDAQARKHSNRNAQREQ